MEFLKKIFCKNPLPSRKVELFSRHCVFSKVSAHKERLPGFSTEGCYRNLIETTPWDRVNRTFFLDLARGTRDQHFLPEEKIIEISEGTEAGSFLKMLEYVSKQNLHPDTILYFIEDDYLHQQGWLDVLLEGFTIPGVDYVTLYDHADKYFAEEYRDLKSRLFVTKTCHFRETPSTTQTFATRFKTLKKDLAIHQKYSSGVEISKDHEKFLALKKRGSLLISSIPGYATHVEKEFASPCVDWSKILNKEFV